RGGGPALGARARGPAAARARAHEPGDREAALHLGPHGRDAPGAHHAEAPPDEPGRARPLRARTGPVGGIETTRPPGGGLVYATERIPSTLSPRSAVRFPCRRSRTRPS